MVRDVDVQNGMVFNDEVLGLRGEGEDDEWVSWDGWGEAARGSWRGFGWWSGEVGLSLA